MEHQTSLTVDSTTQAFHLLTETKIKMLELLQSTPYTNLQVSVENNLNQLINFFRHTTGTSDTTLSNEHTISFESLSSFMGEAVHRPTAIDVALLTPSLEEAELLKQKILQLESSIEELDNDVVINSYALPEEILALRGLAKKLELADYETKPIDYDFINAIRTALVTNKTVENKISDNRFFKENEVTLSSNATSENHTASKTTTSKTKKKIDR